LPGATPEQTPCRDLSGLDRFKYINDSLGHATGDKLLQSVSKRLLAGVRSSDTVSRQGGDEFVILLSEISHPEDAATSARKLLLSLNAPHSIDGHDLDIAGSIGISVCPEDGEDAETLIRMRTRRCTTPRKKAETISSSSSRK
jgi:diguanylate cyclase (GGDEF)-like protein